MLFVGGSESLPCSIRVNLLVNEFYEIEYGECDMSRETDEHTL